MKTLTGASVALAVLLQLCGCQKASKGAFAQPLQVEPGLVNYALPKLGTQVFVSEDNLDHPAETLVNGVRGSENWDVGEGWEIYFDGLYDYAKYTVHADEAQDAARLARQMEEALSARESAASQEVAGPSNLEYGDYKSRGLGYLSFRRMIPTAMGWVVFEIPQEEAITRVDIYTVDSAKYPARNFGVRTLMVQYWSKQGWNTVAPLGRKVEEKGDTVRGNTQNHIVVRFEPVWTSRIRVVVRWTNDTEVVARTRGYHREIRGAVRLTEIEIYGVEDKHQFTSTALNQAEANEATVDEIFADGPDHLPFDAEGPAAVPVDPGSQVEAVVRAYASAYTNRDLSALMTAVSLDYSKGDEDYQRLKGKMDRLFQRYARIEFSLSRLRVKPVAVTATVEADYAVVLVSDRRSPASLSGKLSFVLAESAGGWKITRIDTQRGQ